MDYKNKQPNAVSALAIVVHPNHQGKGVSEVMINEMKRLVKENCIHQMVAPVRPSLKSKYPLVPINEYVDWESKSGKHFDPWIRTHCKTGASIVKIAEKSMVIPATIKQWEKWTNMEFPSSGQYIIPGGLVPLEINKFTNYGIYTEPNVWVKHHL